MIDTLPAVTFVGGPSEVGEPDPYWNWTVPETDGLTVALKVTADP